MANLPRVIQRVFGDTVSPVNNFIQFGSLAVGSPTYTKDAELIQSLDAWVLGWNGAVVGNKSPCLEDMNSLFYVAFRQLAYLLQKGMPEWASNETYYTNGFVSYNGKIYKSLSDGNTNNIPSVDIDNWIEYVQSIVTRPTATFEKTYLFPDLQFIIDRNGNTGGWLNYDLAPFIAAAGLNVAGITVKAAIATLKVKLGAVPFSHATFSATLQAWGNNSAGTPASAFAFMATDDSGTAGSDSVCIPIPLLSGSNIFYNLFSSGSSVGLNGQIYIHGFIYDQDITL